jgi:hypothetical protein
MTKTSAVAACGIVASVGLWRAEAVAVQQLVFRAAVDMVSVPVSVSKGGSPVAGLTAADFELFDNGVRQQLDASSLETLPIDVTQAPRRRQRWRSSNAARRSATRCAPCCMPTIA